MCRWIAAITVYLYVGISIKYALSATWCDYHVPMTYSAKGQKRRYHILLLR